MTGINELENISEVKVSNKDKVCSPDKMFDGNTCYTLKSLINMASAFNLDNPNNIIKLNDTYETLHPKKYKKYLVYQLTKKLSDKCNNQKCWMDQSFMRHIDSLNKNEIKKYTFRPDGPNGKFEWLNTINIDDVMQQYEKKFSDFVFLGAVPIDFDDLDSLGIKTLDFQKLLDEGKSKIGIIFNLDEHWKSGSHWVALYSDLKKGQIYYFDSVGIKPENRIRKLMNRIYRFCKINLGIPKAQIDANYNKERHQFKDSECGVYSINFIVRCLNGEKFIDIQNSKTPDDEINKCRAKYFT